MDDAYWGQFPEVLTIKQVGAIVRRSRKTLYAWLDEGRLPAHYLGGVWIIYKEALRVWIEDPAHPVDALPEQFLARYPEELSALHIAELLGKTRQTVYTLLNKSDLIGHQISGMWLLYKSDFIQSLRASSAVARKVNQAD